MIVNCSQINIRRHVWRVAVFLYIALYPMFASATTVDASSMLWNLYQSLDQVYIALIGTCYILGVGLMFAAFMKLKKFGHITAFMHNTNGIVKPIVQFMIGVMLLYAPSLIDVFIYTLWNYSEVQNTTAWATQYAGSEWQDYIVPLVGLIQVIGLASFIRGWLLLNKCTGEQTPPGTLSKGVMHVIAGVMGINITGTIDTIQVTLGLS